MIEVGVDPDRGIRTVLLDRPESRNALTPEALSSLECAIEQGTTAPDDPACEHAEETHVIELRGVGPAFCAGADLDVVSGLDRESAIDLAERGQRVARAIEASEAIVIASIDGPAMGGGLELALACDVRIATPGATFGEPGVTFGLFGAWGGTVRLACVVGEGNAMDLGLSGRTVDAAEALRMGLVSRIESDPRHVVESIAANPPETLTVLKRRLRDDADTAVQERREAAAFGDLVSIHEDRLRQLRE